LKGPDELDISFTRKIIIKKQTRTNNIPTPCALAGIRTHGLLFLRDTGFDSKFMRQKLNSVELATLPFMSFLAQPKEVTFLEKNRPDTFERHCLKDDQARKEKR
jgi:hypothetical protein